MDDVRTDVEATVAARREVGAELEPQLVDGFLERLERRIEERIGEQRPQASQVEAGDRQRSFVLAMVSLGTGIPISAIAVENGGLPGLLIAWAGIVLVNFVAGRR